MPTLSASVLTDFADRLLRTGGIDGNEARVIAGSLVGANLRGHDSHGVMRIAQYLDSLAKGEIKSSAPLTVMREAPSFVVADGNWGFGQVQAQRLTRLVIDKARQAGVAIGTLIHASHVGRLGEYCEQAAEENLVSLVMANTHGFARRVAPPGGKAPRLGTNPLAFGVPQAEGAPLILDFGTSIVAEGKVRVKRIAGEKCPDGWLLDNRGHPTNDPNDLYANPPGTILPMGGSQPFKGFGLGMMVEVFAGALSGGVCIREVPVNQNGNCMFLLLVDPAQTCGIDHYLWEVIGLTQFVRGCPPIDPKQEITLPGDPELKMLAKRLGEGIPLDDGNWAELVKLSQRLGVKAPC